MCVYIYMEVITKAFAQGAVIPSAFVLPAFVCHADMILVCGLGGGGSRGMSTRNTYVIYHSRESRVSSASY